MPEVDKRHEWGEPAPTPGAPLAVDRFLLANGLEVWHQARPGSGTVSLILLVRSGARHETPRNNGISHFVEHMLFDGTARWSELEIKEVIRRRGGYFNAQTDYEHTAYEVHLLAEDFELALDWLVEIVFRSTFPPDKVERERGVLIQEKGGRGSRFLELLEEWGLGYDLGMAVRRRLYPQSSLGLRVAGEDEPLARIDRDALVDYHHRHYRPNNMALVVVGDVPAALLRAAAERCLAGLEPGPLPALPPAPPPVGRGVRVVLHGPNLADRSVLRRGARTVGAAHPDAAALEVLAELLSNRLTDEVRMRLGLVYAIGAFNVVLSDTGYFVVRTESDAAKMDVIVDSVEAELRRLQREPVPEEELRETKSLLKGQFALTTQSNASLAWLYAGYATWCRPDACVPDYYARIERVTAEDISRVVQRYFVPENSYLGLYRPALTLKTGALGIAAGVALLVGMALWRRSSAA
ncbi:MAG TPA: pitrilysin family protein [Anaerolineae bacterium]|nr:pitrilysin family protein [Anaerolineae bacterium]HOQ99652.1 pitrilysin family protein [Anaerolineae bacterium]HPL26762.1 pitrilysin family protein [Anaerolineae bacterium]